MKGLTIGEVAKEANVNVETVKYYEKRQLLAKPGRNESGYRVFPESVVRDLHFIKSAQTIGFTLNEIKQLMRIANQEDPYPLEDKRSFADAKLKEIHKRIAQLERFKRLLEQAAALSAQDPPSPGRECPVLKTIKEG